MLILPHLKGLPTGTAGSNAFKSAALDLNFSTTKSLVDSVSGNNLVTFNRAGSAANAATYIGSDGLLKSAVTNLLVQSQNFSTSWINTNLTSTSGSIAPDGTATAFTINEDTAVAAAHSTHLAPALTASSIMTLSVYAKNVNARYVGLAISTTSASNYGTVEFDLNGAGTVNRTAVAGTGFSIILSSITAVSSGWFRCVAVIQLGSASVSDGRSTIYVSNGASSFDTRGRVLYTGTSRTLEIWGAQLEQASTVGEYIPTTSTINSAPRFDHNPTTGESLGLLVEEARTNLSLYSEDFSNAYWTPIDCTITPNESTAPDGTLTADLWTNTATPGAINNSITKDATARTYTASLWVKGIMSQFTVTLDGNNTANRGRVQFNLSTNNPIGTSFNDGGFSATSGTLTPYLNGWVRLTLTTTTNTTTTIRLRSFFSNIGTTVRIWGAQVEEGAFATSYIPTTTATVTRAADVASITGSNFSSFYNQTEGTVFANYAERAFSVTHQVATVSNNTANERISLAINPSNILDVGVISGGTDTFGGNTPTLTAQEYKIGFGYKADNSGVSANGSAITVDSAVTLPTVSQLDVGARAGSNQILNSTIKRLTFWPTRLADTTLQQITQP